jgi:ribose transport system substrate-binding protein
MKSAPVSSVPGQAPGYFIRSGQKNNFLFHFHAGYAMKLIRVVCLLLAVAIGAMLPGCGGSGKVQVGFVSNNAEEFWSICQKGAERAAEETGVDLVYRRPSTGQAAEQKEIIDSMLARGVKAISVSVIDSKNQKDFLNQVAKRVPLVTVDSDAPDTDRLCYIGTDNLAAGTTVGELVKKAMPDGGTVALFVGQLSGGNAPDRWHGVLDGLAGKKGATGSKFGKYTIYGQGPENAPFIDDADSKKAKDNADDVLVSLRSKGVDELCLVGLWAYNPPAIYSAVQSKVLQGKVRIVGFDENQETLDGVRKGHIFATVVQDPYNFGYQSVKLMAGLAKGDRAGLPKDKLMPIAHRVVSRDRIEGVQNWMNVDEFQKDLDQKKGR